MIPAWLTALSWIALAAGVVSAVAVALDVIRHPQQMWIMSLVWPITALFGPGLTVWAYLAWGRPDARQARTGDMGAMGGSGSQHMHHEPSFPVAVAKGALHCGSGCTLGDICAELLLLGAPGLAFAFGLGWLFADKIFAAWVLDYILAFLFGIAFQYFTIAPMRHLGVGDGLIAAIKADVLSLTAWQVGMYGFMAIAHFWLFGALLGARLDAGRPEFWFMMQIAMLCGFATSFPVNWWLIRAGLKEAM